MLNIWPVVTVTAFITPLCLPDAMVHSVDRGFGVSIVFALL